MGISQVEIPQNALCLEIQHFLVNACSPFVNFQSSEQVVFDNFCPYSYFYGRSPFQRSLCHHSHYCRQSFHLCLAIYLFIYFRELTSSLMRGIAIVLIFVQFSIVFQWASVCMCMCVCMYNLIFMILLQRIVSFLNFQMENKGSEKSTICSKINVKGYLDGSVG